MTPAQSNRHLVLPMLVACAALMPALAHPHPGHVASAYEASSAGFFEGLLHPLTGLDHLLVLLAAGLIASRLPREQRFTLCGAAGLAFVSGAVIAELADARSSSALEVLCVLAVAGAAALVALAPAVERGHNLALVAFALGVHGWVHGADLQLATPSLGGMALASAVVIAISVMVGDVIATRLPAWTSASSSR